MRKERIFLILGIWVAILPYLGFPYSWKNILFTVSGMVLIYYSYIMYKENKEKGKKPARNAGGIADAGGGKTFDNFSENSDFNSNI